MSRQNQEVGERGEACAQEYLTNAGYQIIARRFRTRQGEIDLIALKDGVLAFCEVKRSRYEGESHPEWRVNRAKQIKLCRCAQSFLLAHPPPFDSCRFDVLAIKTERGRTVVDHIPNAFFPPDGWDQTTETGL